MGCSDSQPVVPLPMKNVFPTKHITEKHLKFFHKYGFMVIKGLHSKEQTQMALKGADSLLGNSKEAVDGGKGEQAFRGLPEHKRSTWAKCEEPSLMEYFEFP